jgi:hypothetical protein
MPNTPGTFSDHVVDEADGSDKLSEIAVQVKDKVSDLGRWRCK